MNYMTKNSESRALVPAQPKTPAPVKKGQLSTPFQIVESTLHLNNKKEVRAILPDIFGRVLARIWIDPDFRDSFQKNPQLTLEKNGVFLPEEMSLEFQKPESDRPRIVVYEKKPELKYKMRILHFQLIMIASR